MAGHQQAAPPARGKPGPRTPTAHISASTCLHCFPVHRFERLQRPLSATAAARVHHVVRVRESQEGGLPRLRVGKEGLKKAFLASVGDHLQAHGVVKVRVPQHRSTRAGVGINGRAAAAQGEGAALGSTCKVTALCLHGLLSWLCLINSALGGGVTACLQGPSGP